MSGGEFAGWPCCDASSVGDWSQLTRRMDGELVVVVPLAPEHEDGLFSAGWRDTAWYSVIAPEWPQVRATLCERLTAHGIGSYAPGQT